jgi:hypothetical protein
MWSQRCASWYRSRVEFSFRQGWSTNPSCVGSLAPIHGEFGKGLTNRAARTQQNCAEVFLLITVIYRIYSSGLALTNDLFFLIKGLSSGRWSNSDMGSPIEGLTLNTSEWPKDAAVCSLSEILETGDLRRAEKANVPLMKRYKGLLRTGLMCSHESSGTFIQADGSGTNRCSRGRVSSMIRDACDI